MKGLFCNLEKAFCVDRGVLLPKFNSHAINNEDQTLYQSYLDNRYFRPAIYNESDKSNKVSSLNEARYIVPHSTYPLYIYIYIYTGCGRKNAPNWEAPQTPQQ
jgi:hypothetical protein